MPIQDFSSPLQDFGTLRLQVSTALGAFPVPDATVDVFDRDGGTMLYRGRTDESGIADGLALPANPAAESQNAETAPQSPRRYIVTVSHPLFTPQTHPVFLFARIKTILPVVLVPLLPTERRS
ncbi:MAG: hypothetical protein IKV99_06270 [Oscillospiraceae bacterium]|nr:hypothetical protein [Oscillospiraceae bacterium]